MSTTKVLRCLSLLIYTVALLSCSGRPLPPLRLGKTDSVHSLRVGPCSGSTAEPTEIDPKKPLVVLVHGCNSSRGRFRALAQVFDFHDQQALCFEYDDRRRIGAAAAELRAALAELSAGLEQGELTLLGHSQGGLVARAALSYGGADALRTRTNQRLRPRLVTVSSPFNGITSASDCAANWLHVLSLGTTLGICRAIAGAKWKDIHPRALLVRRPPKLPDGISEHLEIVTDERDTCRTRAADGGCAQDDFVFSLPEQRNRRMDGDARIQRELVKAGHTEIVGDETIAPRKLIAVLQRHGVLRPTAPQSEQALTALLTRVFGASRSL